MNNLNVCFLLKKKTQHFSFLKGKSLEKHLNIKIVFSSCSLINQTAVSTQ